MKMTYYPPQDLTVEAMTKDAGIRDWYKSIFPDKPVKELGKDSAMVLPPNSFKLFNDTFDSFGLPALKEKYRNTLAAYVKAAAQKIISSNPDLARAKPEEFKASLDASIDQVLAEYIPMIAQQVKEGMAKSQAPAQEGETGGFVPGLGQAPKPTAPTANASPKTQEAMSAVNEMNKKADELLSQEGKGRFRQNLVSEVGEEVMSEENRVEFKKETGRDFDINNGQDLELSLALRFGKDQFTKIFVEALGIFVEDHPEFKKSEAERPENVPVFTKDMEDNVNHAFSLIERYIPEKADRQELYTNYLAHLVTDEAIRKYEQAIREDFDNTFTAIFKAIDLSYGAGTTSNYIVKFYDDKEEAKKAQEQAQAPTETPAAPPPAAPEAPPAPPAAPPPATAGSLPKIVRLSQAKIDPKMLENVMKGVFDSVKDQLQSKLYDNFALATRTVKPQPKPEKKPAAKPAPAAPAAGAPSGTAPAAAGTPAATAGAAREIGTALKDTAEAIEEAKKAHDEAKQIYQDALRYKGRPDTARSMLRQVKEILEKRFDAQFNVADDLDTSTLQEYKPAAPAPAKAKASSRPEIIRVSNVLSSSPKIRMNA